MPSEMVKNKAKFFGAYIMDMLLAYNNTNGSQSIRDFWVCFLLIFCFLIFLFILLFVANFASFC